MDNLSVNKSNDNSLDLQRVVKLLLQKSVLIAAISVITAILVFV